jgi:hypothetical protein
MQKASAGLPTDAPWRGAVRLVTLIIVREATLSPHTCDEPTSYILTMGFAREMT